MKISWELGAEISVSTDHGEVVLTANSAGLTSLAHHLLALAQDTAPSGAHLHYDESQSLETGSVDFIVCKK